MNQRWLDSSAKQVMFAIATSQKMLLKGVLNSIKLRRTMTKFVKFTDTHTGSNLLEKAKEQAHVQLPPLTNDQRKRLARLNGYAAYRLVNYVLANQGCRTDEISPAIAIGNVPDVARKMRSQLIGLGLDISCQILKTTNRYGHNIYIGTWWLTVIDFKKWFGTEAANDESR